MQIPNKKEKIEKSRNGFFISRPKRDIVIIRIHFLIINDPVKCKRTFQKIGCFSRGSTGTNDLLINDRVRTSTAFKGYLLDWRDIGASFRR